ncbi:hypothetical protein Golob_003191 [Gossypium lobatum]|nr:hypothetical protein [Gossypium lobatum]
MWMKQLKSLKIKEFKCWELFARSQMRNKGKI